MGYDHYHCRLTEYPVTINESILSQYVFLKHDYYEYHQPINHTYHDIIYNRELFPYCKDESDNIIPVTDNSWNKDTSPWKKCI